MMDVATAVYDFVAGHPLLVVVVLYTIYNKWKMSQPWPDYGGRLTKVSSVEEWDGLMASSAKAGQLVVVDCYATWCGPCKTAAPVYAQLSEKFSASSIVFAKVDVDAAKGVAAKLAISAMPTFKVFKGGKEVDSSRGWPGAATLEQMLSKHGAVKEAASSKKD